MGCSPSIGNLRYKEFPNVIEIEDPVHGEIKELVYKLDKKVNSQKEELVQNIVNEVFFGGEEQLDANFISIYDEVNDRFHYYLNRLLGVEVEFPDNPENGKMWVCYLNDQRQDWDDLIEYNKRIPVVGMKISWKYEYFSQGEKKKNLGLKRKKVGTFLKQEENQLQQKSINVSYLKTEEDTLSRQTLQKVTQIQSTQPNEGTQQQQAVNQDDNDSQIRNLNKMEQRKSQRKSVFNYQNFNSSIPDIGTSSESSQISEKSSPDLNQDKQNQEKIPSENQIPNLNNFPSSKIIHKNYQNKIQIPQSYTESENSSICSININQEPNQKNYPQKTQIILQNEVLNNEQQSEAPDLNGKSEDSLEESPKYQKQNYLKNKNNNTNLNDKNKLAPLISINQKKIFQSDASYQTQQSPYSNQQPSQETLSPQIGIQNKNQILEKKNQIIQEFVKESDSDGPDLN